MDKFMQKAINLSNKALKNGDIPVAAIIVKNNKIVSSAYNTKYLKNDPTAHAEIIAIRKACKKMKTTHLDGCILYVTLEPCMMCISAICQSHINKIVYCLKSPKYGYMFATKEKFKISCEQQYNFEYEQNLKNFFVGKRKNVPRATSEKE